MLSHDSPTMVPIMTRVKFQISVPNVVNKRKSPKFIRTMPAGIEIKLLIKGIKRQKNTVQTPYFANQDVALWRSPFVNLKIWPHLSIMASSRFISINRPTPYRSTAPNTEPTVEKVMTPTTLRFVVVVIKPPNVRITSDGIGGKIFSRVIKKKIPIYPKRSMISMNKFSMPRLHFNLDVFQLGHIFL